MRILNAFLSLVLILFFTTACSTIVENNLQSNQEVLVESVPSDSDIYMDGEYFQHVCAAQGRERALAAV